MSPTVDLTRDLLNKSLVSTLNYIATVFQVCGRCSQTIGITASEKTHLNLNREPSPRISDSLPLTGHIKSDNHRHTTSNQAELTPASSFTRVHCLWQSEHVYIPRGTLHLRLQPGLDHYAHEPPMVCIGS